MTSEISRSAAVPASGEGQQERRWGAQGLAMQARVTTRCGYVGRPPAWIRARLRMAKGVVQRIRRASKDRQRR